jgi:hypothetical protein
MSKAKRKKQFVARQKAADAILADRDLDENPLTAAEIMALPRNQRPPRSEWPDAGVGNNPNPYPRRKPYKREWFPSSGGGSGADDFVSVIVFLALWAVCSLVFYGVYTSLGMATPFSVIVAVISGLLAATMIRGGGAGLDVTHWW